MEYETAKCINCLCSCANKREERVKIYSHLFVKFWINCWIGNNVYYIACVDWSTGIQIHQVTPKSKIITLHHLLELSVNFATSHNSPKPFSFSYCSPHSLLVDAFLAFEIQSELKFKLYFNWIFNPMKNHLLFNLQHEKCIYLVNRYFSSVCSIMNWKSGRHLVDNNNNGCNCFTIITRSCCGCISWVYWFFFSVGFGFGVKNMFERWFSLHIPDIHQIAFDWTFAWKLVVE